jgi:hypothetical protein
MVISIEPTNSFFVLKKYRMGDNTALLTEAISYDGDTADSSRVAFYRFIKLLYASEY